MWAREALRVSPFVLSFITLVVAQRWTYVLAYLSSVLSFVNHGDHPHWLVLSWFSYSFAFVGYNSEDHVIWLTSTSLGQAGLLLFCDQLAEQKWSVVAAAFLLMLPFQCNNMHAEPLVGAGRLVLYFGLYFWDKDRHWFSRQYPLFGTLEAVFFLFLWHVFIILQGKKEEEEPVLPMTEKDRCKAEISGALP